MDLNFKCPLCETYFDSQDDLKDHVKAAHTSYYYDTYLEPPVLIFPTETTVLAAEAPTTVITTPPVATDGVTIEPVVATDDGCCDCGCCDGETAGSADSGGCGDCDCDCDCVIM